MRTSIWLARHGQTEANRAQRYQGVSDSPLTSYGQQQAAALAWRLRRLPFTVALVSPAGRAQATADVLLAERPDTLRLTAAGWAETHHGRWEGLTYREVLARYPEEAQARFAQGAAGRAQGGESLAEVAARVHAAFAAITQQHRGGRVLVVTHAAPIQIVLCAALGLPLENYWQWRIDLGSLTCLDVYAGATICRMVNEVPRLSRSDYVNSADE
jgi:2,3-bisphosphoglycerate-dependent phosphoglycerate mutase/probable phosphoglycerate mutase